MSKNKYLSFDIGGTTIKYGIIDDHFNIEYQNAISTMNNKNDHILDTIKKIVSKTILSEKIDGIGISSAGIIKDGTVIYSGPTIPNYQGTKLLDEIQTMSNIPTYVINDVNAALLGEKLVGCAKNYSNIYCVALGTGIGGAYMLNGQLVHGSHYTANSLGATLFDYKTQTNYENRASTLSLEKTLNKYKTDVIQAFDYSKKNMEPFVSIINEWSLNVAEGLSNIILLYDPELLIIGGAVSKQGDYLLNILNKHLQNLIPNNLFNTKIVMGQLSNKAQLYGAISPFLASSL